MVSFKAYLAMTMFATLGATWQVVGSRCNYDPNWVQQDCSQDNMSVLLCDTTCLWVISNNCTAPSHCPGGGGGFCVIDQPFRA